MYPTLHVSCYDDITPWQLPVLTSATARATDSTFFLFPSHSSGVTIRFDSYENADEHLVRVLEVRTALLAFTHTSGQRQTGRRREADF